MGEAVAPKYVPMDHQREALTYLMNGGLRAVLVWHRRSGKDLTAFNWTWAASQRRVGDYFYFFPTYSQARKAIWNAHDEVGNRFLSYIPAGLIAQRNGQPHIHETDMRIVFANGSSIQFIGADHIDTVMGTNPVGCVFSEYAMMDPQSWRYMSPILRKNGGWAAFVYTPRGHNHGYDLYERMKERNNWFVQKLTIDDTKLINPDDLEDDRASGIPEEIIQQEYYCSFNVTVAGAYFSDAMERAQSSKRIRELTYNPGLLVHTSWDFGINDATTIWFWQTDGLTYWAIDFYENRNFGLPHYIKELQSRPYVYGTHLAPHDVMKRGDYGTQEVPTSLQETAYDLGLQFTKVDRPRRKEDAIHAGRMFLNRVVLCSERCERGIEGLREYQREWDATNAVHRNTPLHNWASHIADGFMTMACGYMLIEDAQVRPEHTDGRFDPRTYDTYPSFDPRKPQKHTEGDTLLLPQTMGRARYE